MTDVMLPAGMSGIEVARATLRKNPNLPVLLMSGDMGPRTTPEDLASRRVRLLGKPFRTAVLAQAVAGTLAKTRVSFLFLRHAAG